MVVVLACSFVTVKSDGYTRTKRQTLDPEPITKQYFVNKLLTQYGDGEYLTIADVQRLLETLKNRESDNETHKKEQFRRSTDTHHVDDPTNVTTSCDNQDDWMDDEHCLDNMVSA